MQNLCILTDILDAVVAIYQTMLPELSWTNNIKCD